MHACMYAFVYICTCVRRYVRIHAILYVATALGDLDKQKFQCLSVCVCVYVCMHVYKRCYNNNIYVYIYVYIEREREKEIHVCVST